MKRIHALGCLLAVGLLGIGGCASQKDSEIDAAEFALDSCNPSKPTDTESVAACNAALTDANDVLASDPTNVQAGVIASSANLGLAGVDFLQFAKQLVDLSGGGSTDFTSFQTLISNIETANGKAIDTDKLHTAITVLSTALTGVTVTDDLQKRASFQLGAVQSLETFVKPIKLVTTITGGTTTLDVTQITDAVATSLQDDFKSGDGNLVSGGASSTGDTVKAQRAAYCLCTNSAFGYSAACLRDMMRCELSSVTPTPTGTEQDYNGDLTCGDQGVKGKTQAGGTCTTAGGKTADCDALTSPTGATKTAVDNCKASNI